MMNWTDVLSVTPGVTAIIGGGGKTTLLRSLGGELAAAGHTVLLCTTTKIFPFQDIPCVTTFGDNEWKTAKKQCRLICAGIPIDCGKLTAPSVTMEELAKRFEFVLVEADGSAQRPMKAHAAHEPVIPKGANQVICIIGASGFGQPIQEAAHRAERYAALANVSIETEITPEIAACVLRAEHLGDRVLVNQSELAPGSARKLVNLLGCSAVAGSLKEHSLL